jgi:hypothetical protein
MRGTNDAVSGLDVDERAASPACRSSTELGRASTPDARQYSSAVSPSRASVLPRANVPQLVAPITGPAGSVLPRIGEGVVVE